MAEARQDSADGTRPEEVAGHQARLFASLYAAVLRGISERTVHRDREKGRLILYRQIGEV